MDLNFSYKLPELQVPVKRKLNIYFLKKTLAYINIHGIRWN